ncbi:BR-signaling kinase 2 [Striga hermonthica]|uniref:BR-signaling kinase 2 n=1 Tax=Striga hermonthica TaxID=68872 RepID=A0A9N7MNK5_STRHE|nr:BR-signaling kinase 2 [Striga hermonthica]
MDSSLEGQYANKDATALIELATKCLQYEARNRPDVKFLLTAVAPLQKQIEGYKNEEGAENEHSFKEWTQQVKDMLNTKKSGDIAFRDKDFKSTIEYYSKLALALSKLGMETDAHDMLNDGTTFEAKQLNSWRN